MILPGAGPWRSWRSRTCVRCGFFSLDLDLAHLASPGRPGPRGAGVWIADFRPSVTHSSTPPALVISGFFRFVSAGSESKREPMRLSRYFLPILRETPKEAEIISHRLMLRAGMLRQETAGIYALLPLGLRVLKKICAIVKIGRASCRERV